MLFFSLLQSHGFTRECVVYGKIIPEMEEMRKTFGLPSLGFPNCFYAQPEKQVIIMENLKAKGFAMLKMEGN